MINYYKKNNGFTLVEILIVLLVMGLVLTPVYSTFLNSKRNAKSSVEIVDLQQNIRVALETMTADIRMAGFLIPDDFNAVDSMPASLSDPATPDNPSNTYILSLHLATSTGIYTRVVDDFGTFAGSKDIKVAGGMAEEFRTGQGVRIISPFYPDTVTDVVADGVDGVTGLDTDVIKLKSTSPITVNNRDIMMQMNGQDDDAFPVIVRYRLKAGDEVLQRSVNSTADADYETIATNIISVNLSAIPSGAPPEEIKAVRIIVNGRTTVNVSSNAAASPNGDKNRTLQTVVKIENYFEG